MPRLDNTLAANPITAYIPIPRVDSMLLHGVKYLAQQWAASLSSIGRALGRRAPSPNLNPLLLTPPSNVRRMNQPLEAQAPKLVNTLKCNETGREHPVLPQERYKEMLSYLSGIGVAEMPVIKRENLADDQGDAFLVQIRGSAGESLDLLPASLKTSSLHNRGLPEQIENRRQEIRTKLDKGSDDPEILDEWRAEAQELDALSPPDQTAQDFPTGQVQDKFPNTLLDPHTGFAASITLRNDTEVVLNFGGVGSQGHPVKQLFRCFMNVIGMAPPKNFAQASKLTQIVQAHLKELNAQLPPGKTPFSLKLTGHSMGGGMATYAALRNKVPAVVFDPLRLGLGARAKVGRPALKAAPSLVTEVVVQSDWVSDSKYFRGLRLLDVPSLALTGRRADALGAIGNRYMVPKVEGLKPHSQIGKTLFAQMSPEVETGNDFLFEAVPQRRLNTI